MFFRVCLDISILRRIIVAGKEVFLSVDTVRGFMADVFTGLGVPGEEAEICADVLIASDLRGIDSHGVGRLKMYYDRIKLKIQKPVTKIDVIKETETTAVLDGNHGMGQVISTTAMKMAIQKAQKYGMGSVAVRNSTHYGIAGYYPLMAIAEGMIGLTVTNARPSIPPTFGVTPSLGTNPLTFGVPTDEPFPFLIDCATSISQRGKIEFLDRAEKPTPEGWAIDQEGKPVTDTKKLLGDLVAGTAALLPVGGAGELLGGHKGYGWAVMVEILSAALTNGAFMEDLKGKDKDGKPAPYKLGHFFLAINIESFIGLDQFKKTAGSIMRALRNSKKVPGEERIYTAGEKEYEMEKQRRKNGIPINENLQKNLLIMKNELGLTGYDFPF
ncbi:MAG: Ldh family oxidoreductase [Spirochaetales bacterium]|nr:Ldh family oxidoreductase [Spirochaetales bacterium]